MMLCSICYDGLNDERQVQSIQERAEKSVDKRSFLLDSYTYEHYSAHMCRFQ